MAGFGDAFVNAYNAAQANNRANDAADRAAQQFQDQQQDRTESRAFNQHLRDIADAKFKAKDGATTYDSANPFDNSGDSSNPAPVPPASAVPSPALGAATPPAPGASAPPASPTTAGLPTNMALPTPGFIAPQKIPISQAPLHSTDATPTTSPADGVDAVTVATKTKGGPPTEALPTQPQMGDTTGLDASLPDARRNRVPVTVNGQTKFVAPEDAVEMSDADRVKAISHAMILNGDAKGGADASALAHQMVTGQLDEERQALQGKLQNAYAQGGQSGLTAADALVAQASGGHTRQSTLNPDGSLHIVNFQDGHKIGEENIQPDQSGVTPLMQLQQRDLAAVDTPENFSKYVTATVVNRAHGIVNAHQLLEDKIAQDKEPGELQDQKDTSRLKHSQANYQDALAEETRNPHDKTGAKDPEWTPELKPDPETGVMREYQTRKGSNGSYADTRVRSAVFGGEWVQPNYDKPEYKANLDKLAENTGLVSGIGPDGVPGLRTAPDAKGNVQFYKLGEGAPTKSGKAKGLPAAPAGKTAPAGPAHNFGVGDTTPQATPAPQRSALPTGPSASGNEYLDSLRTLRSHTIEPAEYQRLDSMIRNLEQQGGQ